MSTTAPRQHPAAERTRAGEPWRAPYADAPVMGSVDVPPSKSMMNRALVLAAIADGTSRIDNILDADDAVRMVGAITALGATVDSADAGSMTITPMHDGGSPSDADVHCGLAGTVMRFAPAIAPLTLKRVTFTADLAAQSRPLAALVGALTQAGVVLESDGGSLPLTIHGSGRVPGGSVSIDAGASSQFISALMLAGAKYDQGIDITHTGAAMPSQPHLRMTELMLRRCGIQVRTPDDSPRRWSVAAGAIRARDWHIEADVSHALTFAAAAAATAGSVAINDWPGDGVQPHERVISILQELGCRTDVDDRAGTSRLVVHGPATLRPLDIDMRDTGELVPVVAALCMLADGPSRIRGISHIRGHESDRVEAIAALARCAGADVSQEADGIIVTPSRVASRGDVVVDTRGDHRLAAAAAILGLRRPGTLIDDVGVTSKTMPSFARTWQALVS